MLFRFVVASQKEQKPHDNSKAYFHKYLLKNLINDFWVEKDVEKYFNL
jgi:hypothetical protein